MNYQKLLQNKVDRLRLENRYRHFIELERLTGRHPHALWHTAKGPREVIIWCSNDYLGMGQHKVVADAMHTALDQTGAGSGGTRNIGGTSHYHVALEHQLALLHSKESALLYTSAYVANEWTLVALKKIIPDIQL